MHDLTRDVREPEIVAVSPVCQTLVVGAVEVEDGGVQVVDADAVLDGLVSEFVGAAVADAGLDAHACHPDGKCVRVVVEAGLSDLYQRETSPLYMPAIYEHTQAGPFEPCGEDFAEKAEAVRKNTILELSYRWQWEPRYFVPWPGLLVRRWSAYARIALTTCPWTSVRLMSRPP